jgi:hypothetical protein
MTAALRLPSGLAPAEPYVPHPLHDSGRDWPETNCYVDLWIELLHGRGLAPEAMLGFTLRQDFEGDQFTFFKPPPGDIEYLYGLEVLELAVYRDLESHALIQVGAGRPVLVEVDAFYRPTVGTTARRRSASWHSMRPPESWITSTMPAVSGSRGRITLASSGPPRCRPTPSS